MRNIAPTFALALAFFCGAVANAQNASQADLPDLEDSTQDDVIVVKGQKQNPMAIVREVRAISASTDGQLARFQQPICPLVHGLASSYSQQIATRIRALAKVAGLRVAKDGCKANLTLIVTSSGQEFIETLRSERPELLAALGPAEYRALRDSAGPAWSWQSTEPKRADGGPVQYVSELEVGPGAPPLPLSKGTYQVPGARLSRLSEPTRQDVNLSFVVIDRDSLVGLTLQQIGDFFGLAGLTGARFSQTDKLSTPSILKLFNDKADGLTPEDGATEFDIAYLKARYSGAPNKSSTQESKAIAISILQDVGRRND